MALLDKLASGAARTAQTLKLTGNLNSLKEQLKRELSVAGQLAYDQHQRGELKHPAFMDVFDRIKGLQQQLDQLQSQLNSMQSMAPALPSTTQAAGARCPKCGAGLAAADVFCGGCGTRVPKCPGCGAPFGPDEKFCSGCGKPLQAAGENSTPTVTPPQAAPDATSSQP